jgi:hypothetical protein
MADYDVVFYQAGERGDLCDEAHRAAEFVQIARMTPGAELSVMIGGYDDDPRELFDIPEVMAFLRAFVAHIPASEGINIAPRLSYECRAMMLFAIGEITRDQIVTVPRAPKGATPE